MSFASLNGDITANFNSIEPVSRCGLNLHTLTQEGASSIGNTILNIHTPKDFKLRPLLQAPQQLTFYSGGDQRYGHQDQPNMISGIGNSQTGMPNTFYHHSAHSAGPLL